MNTQFSKKCLACGVIFYKKRSEGKRYWKTKKFCSNKCSLTKTTIQKQPNCYSIPKGTIPWNKGLKGFKPWMDISGLKIGHGFYKGKKLPQFSGENAHHWKPKTIKHCPICKKEMILSPWQSGRKFCSLKCRGLGKRDINSPVYKGESALRWIRRRIEEMPEYIEWQKKVRKRDNFRCSCGSNKDLDVHHIISLSEIIKKYHIKTQADARRCKILWDIRNGQTICRKCHRKTDSYFKNRI